MLYDDSGDDSIRMLPFACRQPLLDENLSCTTSIYEETMKTRLLTFFLIRIIYDYHGCTG